MSTGGDAAPAAAAARDERSLLRYPLARVGIVGGGQLGRMLAKRAQKLGCQPVVLDPTPNCPAGQVSGQQIVGGYHDPDKLRELVRSCDVTTFDIEDIDTATLIALQDEGHVIHPSPRLLSIVQDKLTQKRCLQRHGIPTAAFVDMPQADADAFAAFGYPLVHKARRGGYDGRGVAVMRSPADFDLRLDGPALVERFVEADRELAVLVARGVDGDTRCYPPVEMVFRAGVNALEMLLAPARIEPDCARRASDLAMRTVQALDGVGVFGVELFLDRDGELLVNEVAPRTHNSGHHTIEANVTDQFEQHLRAVLGLPLGDTTQLINAAMINLLGAGERSGPPVLRGLREVLRISGVSVHIYGKNICSPNRKMGHVTVVDHDLERARRNAARVLDMLEIRAEEET